MKEKSSLLGWEDPWYLNMIFLTGEKMIENFLLETENGALSLSLRIEIQTFVPIIGKKVSSISKNQKIEMNKRFEKRNPFL